MDHKYSPKGHFNENLPKTFNTYKHTPTLYHTYIHIQTHKQCVCEEKKGECILKNIFTDRKRSLKEATNTHVYLVIVREEERKKNVILNYKPTCNNSLKFLNTQTQK